MPGPKTKLARHQSCVLQRSAKIEGGQHRFALGRPPSATGRRGWWVAERMGLIRLQFTPPPPKRTLAGGEPHQRGSGRTGNGNLERTDPSFVEKPVMPKDKRGFPTPYPHLQRHRHRTIDDAIEVRNEIADGHESSPTSFSFFLDRQPSANETPAPPSPGTSMCVWCCNARTRSSSSSPFSIVCLSFLGNDATVTGGGGQAKFQRQIFRYHISLFLDSRDRRRGDPMLRGWVLSRGGGSDVT